MGTWGTGIFADDTAADIRDDWREAIWDGLSPEEATARLTERYREVREDPDEGPLFWIALAAAQQRTGRFLPAVRDQALALIEAGGDVWRFAEEDPKLGRRRQQALEELAAKMRGPQPRPTQLRRPKPHSSPLDIGDVVLIRGEDGASRGLFVVVHHAEGDPPGSTDPVVAALLWTGGPLPSEEEMSRLPLLVDEPLSFKIDHPVVTFYQVVRDPARGKMALSNFGEIVPHRVARPDSRRIREASVAASSASPTQDGCPSRAGWARTHFDTPSSSPSGGLRRPGMSAAWRRAGASFADPHGLSAGG
jgi:hypothetical protein